MEIGTIGRILIAAPKRAIIDVESAQASPRRRRTRTVQLEEQSAERRDVNEQAGNIMYQLIEKWSCTSDQCSNEGAFCYIKVVGSIVRCPVHSRSNRLILYLIAYRMRLSTAQRRHGRENETRSKASAFEKLSDIIVHRENMAIKREELRILEDYSGDKQRPATVTGGPQIAFYPPYQQPPPAPPGYMPPQIYPTHQMY